jgi:hypothetical protein
MVEFGEFPSNYSDEMQIRLLNGLKSSEQHTSNVGLLNFN